MTKPRCAGAFGEAYGSGGRCQLIGAKRPVPQGDPERRNNPGRGSRHRPGPEAAQLGSVPGHCAAELTEATPRRDPHTGGPTQVEMGRREAEAADVGRGAGEPSRTADAGAARAHLRGLDAHRRCPSGSSRPGRPRRGALPTRDLGRATGSGGAASCGAHGAATLRRVRRYRRALSVPPAVLRRPVTAPSGLPRPVDPAVPGGVVERLPAAPRRGDRRLRRVPPRRPRHRSRGARRRPRRRTVAPRRPRLRRLPRRRSRRAGAHRSRPRRRRRRHPRSSSERPQLIASADTANARSGRRRRPNMRAQLHHNQKARRP